uniref:(S)-2-hydroxy-acid oxidase n=2 Tax=Leptobrachium leishanense TaxID=445787 RepID=A0A8C5PC91_9ANUR
MSGQGDAEMSLICLSDFEAYAKDHLPKATWEYYAAGADDCCTRDDNLLAFKRIRLRPRMLRDVAIMDTRTTVLGTEINCPIGIAPTAFHCLAWPDGEMSTARAAESLNLCYVASTYSTCSVEEIVTAAPDGFRWFQLYVYRDRKLSEQLVHRVEALGFKALVLTVDVPYTGKRRSDIRNNFRLPPHLKVKNFEGVFEEHCGPDNYGVPANTLDPSISWKDIYWLRSITRLPIIIKGILTKEDAELAVEHGVQGIIVSNHGGRQLDGELATVRAYLWSRNARLQSQDPSRPRRLQGFSLCRNILFSGCETDLLLSALNCFWDSAETWRPIMESSSQSLQEVLRSQGSLGGHRDHWEVTGITGRSQGSLRDHCDLAGRSLGSLGGHWEGGHRDHWEVTGITGRT